MQADSSFYSYKNAKYNYDKGTHYGTAFIVNQQQETYVFPYDGYYACLIDFSDSLISRNFTNFTSQYIKHINFDDVIDNEKDTIFHKLSRTLSYVERHKDKVEGAIVAEYDAMFKAISALDYVYITRNLKLLFERELAKPLAAGEKRKFYVDDKIMKRLEYMEERSLEFMLESIQKIVNGDTTDIPFVGDVLLPEFYKKYMYDRLGDKKLPLYEVYKFNADWKSSVVLYEDYPIWAKKDKVSEKVGTESANELFGLHDLPVDMGRDIHLSFLIEHISAKYDLEIEQRTSSVA